ncbi:MAG: hypothetical protein ACRCUS_06845 [Anaerovoracaceae bacterium]
MLSQLWKILIFLTQAIVEIETGVNNGWEYTKYSNGKYIAIQKKSQVVASTSLSSVAPGLLTWTVTKPTLPSFNIAGSDIAKSVIGNANEGYSMQGSPNASGSISLFRIGTTALNLTVNASWEIEGRWKA